MLVRTTYSFVAMFVGWFVPLAGYIAWLQFEHDLSDFEFMFFWPLGFTVLGWLFIGLPIAIRFDASDLEAPGTAVFRFTVATTLSFLLLAWSLEFAILGLIWWPILTGVIGGVTFWFLIRRNVQPLLRLWLIPILLFPFVRFFVLPFGVEYFPYTTYVLTKGMGDIDTRALLTVLERVEVGDSYQELHRLYPSIFDEPSLGGAMHGLDGWRYRYSFDKLGGHIRESGLDPDPFQH